MPKKEWKKNKFTEKDISEWIPGTNLRFRRDCNNGNWIRRANPFARRRKIWLERARKNPPFWKQPRGLEGMGRAKAMGGERCNLEARGREESGVGRREREWRGALARHFRDHQTTQGIAWFLWTGTFELSLCSSVQQTPFQPVNSLHVYNLDLIREFFFADMPGNLHKLLVTICNYTQYILIIIYWPLQIDFIYHIILCFKTINI